MFFFFIKYIILFTFIIYEKEWYKIEHKLFKMKKRYEY